MQSQYETDLQAFVQHLNLYDGRMNESTGSRMPGSGTWVLQPGRKYDKVYLHQPSVGGKVFDREGRFMIDRKTTSIYGVKSWAMVNLRRNFGTLSTFEDWDWSAAVPTVTSGTASFEAHLLREACYKSTYKKRGRPRKASKVSNIP